MKCVLLLLYLKSTKRCVRYGLDGFAVESGAGEIGQADFVASYFQIVGGALSQCLADLELQLLLFSLCSLDQLGGLLVLLDKGQ